MSKHKFVYADDMVEGTLTLGVVYYLMKEREIKQAFDEIGLEPPYVVGYVVNKEEAEEENA